MALPFRAYFYTRTNLNRLFGKYLFMEETKNQLLYLALIALTILDILLIAYVVFYHVPLAVKYNIYAFDFFVCALMWVEFVYSYRHADDKKHYLKENSISILGMLPINFVLFRALRLVKLVHLIKSFVIARETTGRISHFLKQTYLDKIILVAIIFVLSISVLIDLVDSNINTMSAALWYVVVSMTSTGYGDIIPASTSGKILGMVAMVGGILVFASFTAVVSSLYVSKINNDKHRDLESKIDELSCEIEKLNKKIDEL